MQNAPTSLCKYLWVYNYSRSREGSGPMHIQRSRRPNNCFPSIQIGGKSRNRGKHAEKCDSNRARPHAPDKGSEIPRWRSREPHMQCDTTANTVSVGTDHNFKAPQWMAPELLDNIDRPNFTSSEFFKITEQNPEAMFLGIKYLLQLVDRHTSPYRYPVSLVALKEGVVDYFSWLLGYIFGYPDYFTCSMLELFVKSICVSSSR